VVPLELYKSTISSPIKSEDSFHKTCLDAEPLQDKEAFNIRRKLINTLIDKNQDLQEQIRKLEQEIHLNNQIIGQLRENTPPGPFQADKLLSPKWKRRSRKLQAGIEQNDPSKKKTKLN
jgi:predicted nucleotidyltransferase component of viral defense system